MQGGVSHLVIIDSIKTVVSFRILLFMAEIRNIFKKLSTTSTEMTVLREDNIKMNVRVMKALMQGQG